MEVINNTKNTIYAEDIDYYIPFADGQITTIDTELLRRSKCLRAIVISSLDIVSYDENEQIEKSLVYLKSKSPLPAKREDAVPAAPVTVTNGDGIEVKLRGLFFDASGYAKVNRNLAIALSKVGYKVQIEPKNSQNQLNRDELTSLTELQKTQVSKRHICIDSIIPSFAEAGTGAYKVLYTTIESYTVPKQFVECCKLYDEVWTTSSWSASVLGKYIDKPVYPVCTGVDPDLYCEHGDRFDFGTSAKNFIFISVFSWNYRKGYDVLLKAFFDEFSDDDDVSLLIFSRYQSGQSKFHKDKIKNDINEIMKEFPNKDIPHVVRYSKIVSERDMPKLYRACNAFVLPSRGEGGCLPPIEASLCGLPVIMTNCSGQQGYLRNDNAYLIDIDLMETIQPGQMKIHFWDGQQFPSFKTKDAHDQTKKHMRHVFNNYQEAKMKNKNLQKLILNEFTWEHTAKAASERLIEINKKLRR